MPAAETITTAAGVWAAALALVGLFLRQIGPWRKQISEAEERLRKALEDAPEKEREAHAADLERERLSSAKVRASATRSGCGHDHDHDRDQGTLN